MGNTNRPLKGVGEEGVEDGVSPIGGGARVQPLGFHEQHSEHIQLSLDGRTARRVESFCKGICFSNRPVAVNERIYVRISEVSTSWSGVLRLGFTSVDPATIDPTQLPRYACPDLTTRQGYWAKALPERFAEQGTLLVYGVTRSGDVRFGVNGQDKGIFFADVNTSGPLWALVDIYGNSMGMQFIDEDQYNAEVSRILRLGNGGSEGHTVLAQSPEGNRAAPVVISGSGSKTVNGSTKTVVAPAPPLAASSTIKRLPGSSLAASTALSPPTPAAALINDGGLAFHTVTGRNVVFSSSDRRTASRRTEDYCNGYVLTNRPLRPGEKLVVTITRIDITYEGTLAFGLTSCDPAGLTAKDLPDDSDLLLDRPEYWVVYKDVCAQPQVNDELCFQLMPDGEVKYSRNGQAIVSLVFVDMTLPLWGFFDIYGSVQTIKLAGAHRSSPLAHPSNVRQESLPSGSTPLRSISSAASLPANFVTTSSQPPGYNQQLPRKSVTTMETVPPRPAATPPPSSTGQRVTPPPRPSQPAARNSPLSSRRSSQPPTYSSVMSSSANTVTPPSLPPKHGRPGGASPSTVPPIPNRPSELLRQADSSTSLPAVNRLPPPLIPMPVDFSPAAGLSASFANVDIGDGSAPPPTIAPPALPAKSSSVQPAAEATLPRVQQPQSLPVGMSSSSAAPPSQQPSPVPPSPVQPGPTSMPLTISAEAIQNANNECVVCMERPSNSVVYACGHLCLCWDCATNIRNHTRPLCPICQQEVRDIIKIFRS